MKKRVVGGMFNKDQRTSLTKKTKTTTVMSIIIKHQRKKRAKGKLARMCRVTHKGANTHETYFHYFSFGTEGGQERKWGKIHRVCSGLNIFKRFGCTFFLVFLLAGVFWRL
jgi:hypothetical protein